jgi:hypothetical protein
LINCEENVVVDNSDEATRLAAILHGEIWSHVAYRPNVSILAFANVLNVNKNSTTNSDGKLTLNLPEDVIVGNKVLFKKGEGLFKAYNKLVKLVAKEMVLPCLDDMAAFKEFSSANIPAKEHKLVFSSDGVDGVWDIATMSMRGISSCQSWTSSNSKHLVGSMLDPFTGILYITSGSKVGDVGTKMFRRSLVRLVVNEHSKKESLLIERMYPSYDKNIATLFKDFLIRKTDNKYPVIDTLGTTLYTDSHYSPCSNTIRSLPVDNRPYCDSKVEYKTDKNDVNGLRKEKAKAYIERLPQILALKVLALIKLLPKKSLSAQHKKTLMALSGTGIDNISYLVYDKLQTTIMAHSIKNIVAISDDLDISDSITIKQDLLLKWVKASIVYSLNDIGLPAGKANVLPDSVLSGACKVAIEQIKADMASACVVKKVNNKTKTSDKLYLSLLSY